MTSERSLIITICGGGNGAHVAAGLFSSHPELHTTVRVLSLYKDEAERWNNALQGHEFLVSGRDMEDKEIEVRAKPQLITNNAAEAVKDANMVFFIVPAFAHDVYFEAMKDHLDPGTIIIGIPSAAGFEFAARGILGHKAHTCTLMSYESLPWACRIHEFGRHAHVIGFKEELAGACHFGIKRSRFPALETIQKLIGKAPKIHTQGHLLGCTLMGTNSYLHPAIMYGQWHKWDGKPLKEPPLFYQGVDAEAAKVVDAISHDVVAIAQGIMKVRPKVDLTIVRPIYQWYMDCYGHQIDDKTNTQSVLNTNKGYTGLTHPTKKVDGGYVADFKYRYLSEDLPMGLVVIKGIAEIAQVETPTIDKVLTWGQEKLGKEYLVNGKLTGKDVATSRAPQRYGLHTLDDIVGFVDN